MQAANRLQKALRTGSGLTFGAWQMLPGTNHARVMARSGFDWICVDTEHGNIDGMKYTELQFAARIILLTLLRVASDAAMHEAVAAIAACDVSPVVRIAANEGWMVKRTLYLSLPLSVWRPARLLRLSKFQPIQEPSTLAPMA